MTAQFLNSQVFLQAGGTTETAGQATRVINTQTMTNLIVDTNNGLLAARLLLLSPASL